MLVLLSTLLSAGFSLGNSSSLFVLLSDVPEVDSNFDGGELNCLPLTLSYPHKQLHKLTAAFLIDALIPAGEMQRHYRSALAPELASAFYSYQ
jgi:hypothetical protein